MSEVIRHTLFTNTFEQGVRVNSHQQKALLVVRVTEAHAVGGLFCLPGPPTRLGGRVPNFWSLKQSMIRFYDLL